MTGDLKITPLQRSVARLEEALQADPGNILVRDGLVQRFEFTCDISQRMIRRYLAGNISPPEVVNALAFADIIRMANQNQLLPGDWARWKTGRDIRARTSHS